MITRFRLPIIGLIVFGIAYLALRYVPDEQTDILETQEFRSVLSAHRDTVVGEIERVVEYETTSDSVAIAVTESSAVHWNGRLDRIENMLRANNSWLREVSAKQDRGICWTGSRYVTCPPTRRR